MATRFDLVVSEKLLLQSLPIVGALAGAMVNAAFTDHFNRVAGYHFGIRRIEREKGEELVREEYLRTLGRDRPAVQPRTPGTPTTPARRSLGRDPSEI